MSELAAKILRERNMKFATSPHEPPTPFHSQNEIALAEQLTAANARVAELESKHDRIRIAVRALLRNPLMSAGRFIDELVKEFDQ